MCYSTTKTKPRVSKVLCPITSFPIQVSNNKLILLGTIDSFFQYHEFNLFFVLFHHEFFFDSDNSPTRKKSSNIVEGARCNDFPFS